MLNEKFYLALAFLAFFLLVLRFAKSSIVKALEAKSRAIAEEILAAKELKERADQLLARAEKYARESEEYAKNLLKNAELEAEKFATESAKAIEEELTKKTTAALDRIKMEEMAAIREIKNRIISSAIQNLSETISKDLDDSAHNNLFNKAEEDLNKIIH